MTTPKYGSLATPIMSASGTYQKVYTVPLLSAGIQGATVNYLLLNQDPTVVANVKIYMSMNSTTPGVADMIKIEHLPGEYTLTPSKCRAMSPGESLYVYCDNNNVSIRVEGIESPVPTA